MPFENSENQNPYQAPTSTAGPVVAVQPAEPFSPGKIFLKWFLVCVVSAAPSFFWGMVIGEQELMNGIGMLLGVLTFVTAYTAIECLPAVRQWMSNRQISLTAKIAHCKNRLRHKTGNVHYFSGRTLS